MPSSIYQQFISQKQLKKKNFAVLIDPDRAHSSSLNDVIRMSIDAKVDYFFVGGSLVMSNVIDDCIQLLKSKSKIPVVLFPGSPAQVSKYADALFYLSLISGRNPELLIGQHVISAAQVKSSGLEIIPTGYIVVDGGAPTSVSYISNTNPIPNTKNDIALCTALAGEMLGMKLIYMDAGSGALKPIPCEMISKVSASVSIPIIVGGGITTPTKAFDNCKAGADIIVVGNAIEKDASLINDISQAVHSIS